MRRVAVRPPTTLLDARLRRRRGAMRKRMMQLDVRLRKRRVAVQLPMTLLDARLRMRLCAMRRRMMQLGWRPWKKKLIG